MKKMMVGFAALTVASALAETVTYQIPSGWDNTPNLSAQSYSNSTLSVTNLWSDGLAAHGGADYVFPGTARLYVPAKYSWTSDYVFPGSSITMKPTGDGKNYWEWHSKSLTITNLIIETGATVNFVSGTSDLTTPVVKPLKGESWTLNGSLSLSSSQMNRAFDLVAPLSGSGSLYFTGWCEANNSYYKPVESSVSGDNSAYSGSFSFDMPYATNLAYSTGVKIASAKAMGGALAEANPKAVTLASFNGLHATQSLTLDAVNRGYCVSNGYFEADAGITLTLKAPLRLMKGGFYQRGAGTFALASTTLDFGEDGTDAADGENSRFVICSGTFKPMSEVVRKLDVVFEDVAMLALDAQPADATLATNGFCCRSVALEGAYLNVRIDFDGTQAGPGSVSSVVLCTVSAEEAARLQGRLRVFVADATRTTEAEITREVLVDGRVRLTAHVVAPARRIVIERDAQDGFVAQNLTAAQVGVSGDVVLVNGGAVIESVEACRHLIATLGADVRDVKAREIKLEGFANGLAPFLGVEIEGQVGSVRSVYAVVLPQVTYTGTGGHYDNYLETGDKDDVAKTVWKWSDQQAAHCGADYVIGKSFTGRTTGDNIRAFPGRSLCLQNDMLLGCFAGQYVISNLTLVAGRSFRIESRTQYHTKYSLVSTGGWNVDGTLSLRPINQAAQFVLSAELTGTGRVEFAGWKSGTWTGAGLDQEISSTNGVFKGRFLVALPETTSASLARGITIAHPYALGGAMDAFTYDALELRDWQGLKITESMTLATPNRGILMGTNAFFEVATGKAFALCEPLRVKRGFMKRGAGTLEFGAPVLLGADGQADPDGVNNILTVEAGGFKPLTTDGLEKLDLVFAEGSKLVIDAESSDPDVQAKGLSLPRETGLTVSGERFPVEIETIMTNKPDHAKSVRLMTLPTATANALVSKIDVTIPTIRGGMARLSVVPAGDGLARIEARILPKSGLLVAVF